MFKILVQAKTIEELREKVLRIGNSLTASQPETAPVYDTTKEDEEVQESYDEAKPPEDASSDTGSTSAPVVENAAHGSHDRNGSAELDANGRPYDKRIHSETKGLNKDGTWRYRRNVDKNLVAKVEAEFAAAAPVAPTVSAPPLPPMPTAHASPVAPVQELAKPVEAPIVPAAPTYADEIKIPNETKPAHSLESFTKQFIPVISSLIRTKKINESYVQSLKEYFKVADIWDVLKSPEQTKEMFEGLVDFGVITKVD